MRKSGLTGDEAYILAKRGETAEDLGPLKKEIGLIKEDLGNFSDNVCWLMKGWLDNHTEDLITQ